MALDSLTPWTCQELLLKEFRERKCTLEEMCQGLPSHTRDWEAGNSSYQLLWWWGNQNMENLGRGLVSPWQGGLPKAFCCDLFSSSLMARGQGSEHPGIIISNQEQTDPSHASSRRTPRCYWRCWTERSASAVKPGSGVTRMADRPERPTWHWPGQGLGGGKLNLIDKLLWFLSGEDFEKLLGCPMVPKKMKKWRKAVETLQKVKLLCGCLRPYCGWWWINGEE